MKKKQPDSAIAQQQNEQFLRRQLVVKLAGIPSLALLSKQEKRLLVEEAERAGIAAHEAGGVIARGLTPVRAEARKAWGMKTPPPRAWGALVEVHPWVQQLPSFLAGKPLRLPVVRPALFRLYRWNPTMRETLGYDAMTRVNWSHHGTRALAYEPSPGQHLLDAFADDLTTVPLPYRRCPECHTIFVVVRQRGTPRQFCSSRCAHIATDGARAGTRNDYMRELMAKRRAAVAVPLPEEAAP